MDVHVKVISPFPSSQSVMSQGHGGVDAHWMPRVDPRMTCVLTSPILFLTLPIPSYPVIPSYPSYLFLAGGTGAGMYSIVTLLMTAIGRPGAV